MANHKEENAERSGTTVKFFDAVIRHIYPTRRAMTIFHPALSKPLPVVLATNGGLFLAGRKYPITKPC